MKLNERQRQLLEILQVKQSVTLGYFCNQLYASEATIRRDLVLLEKNGLIIKIRGGAVLPPTSTQDQPLLMRKDVNRAQKDYIARLALKYIPTDSTCFFDSSSTVNAMARHTSEKNNIVVISNGLDTISYLNEYSDFPIIAIGGRLLDHSAFVGDSANQAVEQLCADIFFFSCCGISESGTVTEAVESNSSIKRRMIRNAKKRILLCDSTKFDKQYISISCHLQDIDLVITDKKPKNAEALMKLTNVIWG